MNTSKQQVKETLEELLSDYYHYRFMRANFFEMLLGVKLDLLDFMRWLKSIKD